MAAAVEGSAVTPQQQLALLNAEAQELSKQLDQARKDWLANREDAELKQDYEDIKTRLKDLDQRRAKLESQLTCQVQPPVPGGGVTEVLQAINELRVTNRHELDIVKKQLQQQQFLMTKTATYSMLGVITALYPQPSQLSGGRDRRFREKLINYYKSNKQGGLMLCTVLGQYVESDAIVAGHLFPTRRAVLAEQFGIRQQDVNNARNGLLWCQCIEYAFELMKVTIAPGPLPGQFTFHVVDDALRNTPLCQHAGECKGSSYLQALEGKTYRDLDGTLLTFPSECPADHRPMERAVLAHFMVSVSLHRGTGSILPAGLQAVVQNCKVHSPMAQQAATLSWLQATCSVQPDTSVESAEAVWHSAPVPLGVGAEGEPDLSWSETEDEE